MTKKIDKKQKRKKPSETPLYYITYTSLTKTFHDFLTNQIVYQNEVPPVKTNILSFKTRAAKRGKTVETAVLSEFCEIKCCADSGSLAMARVVRLACLKATLAAQKTHRDWLKNFFFRENMW